MDITEDLKKFDPLVYLPEDELNIIFEQLSSSDLLKMSLVSKHWYNLIGRTDGMKKIEIFLTLTFGSAKKLDCLMKSSRLYQNIRISSCWINHHDLWYFERKAKPILERFSGTLKSIHSSMDFKSICDFPKLKKLVFIKHLKTSPLMRPYSTGLFSKIEHLEELHFNHSFESFQKIINNALKTMKNLKVLEIGHNFMDGTEYSFRLHTFTFKGSVNNNNFEALRFLKSQSSSLKKLKLWIRKYDCDEIISIIMNMPYITHLGISYGSYYPSRYRTLKYSRHGYFHFSDIKSFRARFGRNSDHFFCAIMANLRNVEMLNIYEITSEHLEIILQSTTLRTVNFVWTDLTDEQEDVINSHPRIKFNFWSVSKFIKSVW